MTRVFKLVYSRAASSAARRGAVETREFEELPKKH